MTYKLDKNFSSPALSGSKNKKKFKGSELSTYWSS